MLKKLKRSIETLPCSAYIFLIFCLKLSCLMLGVSALLFAGADGSYGQIKLAILFLENPAGILLLALIGTTFFIDRS